MHLPAFCRLPGRFVPGSCGATSQLDNHQYHDRNRRYGRIAVTGSPLLPRSHRYRPASGVRNVLAETPFEPTLP